MIRTKAATAHSRCFCMRNLPAPDSVAHGVGRTTNFLGNLGRRPAIAESCLDDDSFFECEVCPFAMRRFCDTLLLIHSGSPLVDWSVQPYFTTRLPLWSFYMGNLILQSTEKEFAAREAAILAARKKGDVKAEHTLIEEWKHERFARGFEVYIKEGKAPTGRLASIFEKGKRFFAPSITALRTVADGRVQKWKPSWRNSLRCRSSALWNI